VLSLDDPRWAELQHAYGSAKDTPELLRRVYDDPDDSDAWYELWGSICHQGTAYQASFAAVPHLVAIAERSAACDRADALSLVACIVISAYYIPPDLSAEFREALGRIPTLAAETLGQVEEDQARHLIVALAAGHECVHATDVLEPWARGSDLVLRCPSDDCAVLMTTENASGQWSLVVDEDRTSIMASTVRDADWHDETAALAAAAAADRAGCDGIAHELRALAGIAACPSCDAPVDVWRRLLIGDDL
jgi:hypothetical protein